MSVSSLVKYIEESPVESADEFKSISEQLENLQCPNSAEFNNVLGSICKENPSVRTPLVSLICKSSGKFSANSFSFDKINLKNNLISQLKALLSGSSAFDVFQARFEGLDRSPVSSTAHSYSDDFDDPIEAKDNKEMENDNHSDDKADSESSHNLEDYLYDDFEKSDDSRLVTSPILADTLKNPISSSVVPSASSLSAEKTDTTSTNDVSEEPLWNSPTFHRQSITFLKSISGSKLSTFSSSSDRIDTSSKLADIPSNHLNPSNEDKDIDHALHSASQQLVKPSSSNGKEILSSAYNSNNYDEDSNENVKNDDRNDEDIDNNDEPAWNSLAFKTQSIKFLKSLSGSTLVSHKIENSDVNLASIPSTTSTTTPSTTGLATLSSTASIPSTGSSDMSGKENPITDVSTYNDNEYPNESQPSIVLDSLKLSSSKAVPGITGSLLGAPITSSSSTSTSSTTTTATKSSVFISDVPSDKVSPLLSSKESVKDEMNYDSSGNTLVEKKDTVIIGKENLERKIDEKDKNNSNNNINMLYDDNDDKEMEDADYDNTDYEKKDTSTKKASTSSSSSPPRFTLEQLHKLVQEKISSTFDLLKNFDHHWKNQFVYLLDILQSESKRYHKIEVCNEVNWDRYSIIFCFVCKFSRI